MNNKIKKILIIPVILSFFCISSVLADNSDCGIFGAMLYSTNGSFPIVDNIRETQSNEFTNFLTVQQQQEIIHKEDLNTAIMNLKKYCCQKRLGDLSPSIDTCKKDTPYFNNNALQSPYLFDHLFDVIMRRLAGLDGDTNIYTNTNMTLDKKGQERRERISEQAKAPEGSIPQTIINKYEGYWKQSPANLGYNISKDIHNMFTYRGINGDQVFLKYVSGQGETAGSKSLAKAFKEYSEWTLYDRYKNACALSEYFYSLLDMGIVSDDKRVTINKLASADSPCAKAVDKQVKGETSYVTLVTKRSSNGFMGNYVQGYLSYTYERQQRLLKLWKDIVDRWLDVTRAVPCLQHTCVK